MSKIDKTPFPLLATSIVATPVFGLDEAIASDINIVEPENLEGAISDLIVSHSGEFDVKKSYPTPETKN